MAELKASVIIQAQDRFSAVAKKVEAAGGKLSKKLTESQRDLAALGKQAAAVKQFGVLKKSLSATSEQMRAAQDRAQALGRKIAATAEPTKKLRREFEHARRETRRLGQRHRDLTGELQRQRSDLRGAGIDTRNLADAQRRLSDAIDTSVQKMGRLGSAAEAAAGRVSAAQGRVAEAQARHDKRVQTAANLSLVSGAVERTGQRLLSFVEAPTRAAMDFESVMADVRKVVDFETPEQFQAMSRDILNLSKRIPKTAAELGEIVAAAGRAGIARGELLRFTEDAAKMGVAFDLSGAEAGGAMTGLRSIFKLNQDQVVSLGDTYNRLDNNMDATAAGILNIANRTGAMGQSFGLSGQQVGALAATFLALKTAPEVASTSINTLLLRLQTAHKQGKKFKQALASIGLSSEGLQESLERDAQGTLLELFEAVREADDKQGVLFDLFGQEFTDDIDKLIGGLDIYRKAVGLAADREGSAGSMQAEFETRAATAANAVMLTENSARALQIALGDVLLPDVTRLSEATSSAADVTGRLIEDFPGLSKWTGRATAALGGLAKVAAPVLEASGAALMAAAWMQMRAAKAQLAAAGRGVTGDIIPTGGGGKTRNAGQKITGRAKELGSKIRGFGGKLPNLMKGRFLGPLGVALGAYQVGSTLLDSDMTAAEKTRSVGADVGLIGGALGGAKLGAIAGTALGPIGTLAGGTLGAFAGGIAGGYGGSLAGEGLAGLFGASDEAAAASGETTVNNDNHIEIRELVINQQPGEDARAMAEGFLRMVDESRRDAAHDALYDD